jgi:outer membrane protein assembly factor BamB
VHDPDENRTDEAVQELQDHDLREVGPYRVLGLLGAGGMGQVYLAVGDGGPVAVKIVHPWLADDEQFRARFAREVAASRAVRSPWAAAVVDADADAALPWLATEYIPGVPLDVATRSAGPLPAASVHVLAADMARALAAIHAAGLVHRDVKPGNVLMTAERPYLLDFGISRALDGTQLTGTGAVIGTPAYMSPEQAEGLETGPASDLFSLAAVLVFAATGVGPFGEGTPVALLRRILVDEPDLGGLTEPVRTAAARCLHRDPGDRPSAEEMAELLEPLPAIPRYGWLPPAVTALVPTVPVDLTPPESTSAAPPVAAPTAADPTVAGPTVAGPTAAGPTAAVSAPSAPAPGPRRIPRRGLLVGAGILGVIGAGAGIGLTLGGREPGGEPSGPATTAPTTAPASPPVGKPVIRWTFQAAGEVRGMTFSDGTLYASSAAAEVYAIDPASGQARWTFTLDAPMWTPPRVTDGVVAVGGDLDALYALDAATGRLLWSTEFATVIGAGNGTVLARVYDQASASRYVMTAFDAVTGAPRWSYPIPDSDDVFTVLPAFDGGLVHVGMDRSVLTFHVATGALQRQLPAEGMVEELGIAGGLLYYRVDAGDAGGVYGGETFVAIDPIAAAPRWRRTAEGGLVFPGTVDGGVLFMEAMSIQAWDAATGEPRWAVESGRDWDNSLLAAAGGICYIGGAEPVYGPDSSLVKGPDGNALRRYSLTAFSADSGKVRWRLPIEPGPGLGAPLVAVPGTVFLGGTTALVHAVSEV